MPEIDGTDYREEADGRLVSGPTLDRGTGSIPREPRKNGPRIRARIVTASLAGLLIATGALFFASNSGGPAEPEVTPKGQLQALVDFIATHEETDKNVAIAGTMINASPCDFSEGQIGTFPTHRQANPAAEAARAAGFTTARANIDIPGSPFDGEVILIIAMVDCAQEEEEESPSPAIPAGPFGS